MAVVCTDVPPFWCPDLDMTVGDEKEILRGREMSIRSLFN